MDLGLKESYPEKISCILGLSLLARQGYPRQVWDTAGEGNKQAHLFRRYGGFPGISFPAGLSRLFRVPVDRFNDRTMLTFLAFDLERGMVDMVLFKPFPDLLLHLRDRCHIRFA